MIKSKLGWVLVGVLVGAVVSATTIIASSDDRDIPVNAEGMLVEATFNTDWQQAGAQAKRAELEKVIEGSVSFKIDVPMNKIKQHMTDPGTWGKISGNVADYVATKVKEDENEAIYKIEQTLVPTQFPGLKGLTTSKVYLQVGINKRAAREDAIAIRFGLDPEKQSNWKRFSGRVYAVDLHNGKTVVLLTSSTQSPYGGIPDRVRLKLVEHYLAKTKDNIVKWVKTL